MEAIADKSHPGTTAARAEPPGPCTSPPAPLELIQTVLSADGRHIHLHFVAQRQPVMIVQLGLAEAAKFHQGLGEVLQQTQPRVARETTWH